MTGTPVSSCTRISACDTLSQMYSKCMVEPLMRTPMAITASNGWLDMPAVTGAGVAAREDGRGEEMDTPKLSPPSRSVADAPAWIWEPAITLQQVNGPIPDVRSRGVPLAGKGKLEAAGDRLEDNIALLHPLFLEFVYGTLYECINDSLVPSRMDYGDAEVGAVELGLGGSRAFY